MRNERFGALLGEGLSSVAKRHHRTLRAIDREITTELRLKEWTVQGWRRGYLPREPEQCAYLVRYCVANGQVRQEWVHSLLLQAHHPTPEAVLRELFPMPATSAGPAQIPHIYHNLPPLHGEFLDREHELARVLEGLTSAWPVVSIEGLAGTGKTTLAIAAARRCLSQSAGAIDPPFQAVAWISARDHLDKRLWLDEVLDTIARVLNYPYIAQLATEQKRLAVEQLLRGHRTLVVVDNFETIEDTALTAWIVALPEPSKAMITTRQGQLDGSWDTHLGGLDAPIAFELIRLHAHRLGLHGIETARERELAPLVSVTRGNPRALGMAVGHLKGGYRRLPTIISDLHAASESVGDIFGSLFDWHWETLTDDARHCLLVMHFFAESADKTALGAAAGLEDKALDAALERLAMASLIDASDSTEPPGTRYRIHPLTRAFVTAAAARPAAHDWIAGARARWVGWYQSFVREQAAPSQEQSAARTILLQQEWPNLTSVLSWCAANTRYQELRDLWFQAHAEQIALASGYWQDALQWSEWLKIAGREREDWPTVAHALGCASWAHIQMGSAAHLRAATNLLAEGWSLRDRLDSSSLFSLVAPSAWLRVRQQRYAKGLWWLDRAERLLQSGELPTEDHDRMLIHIPFYRGLTYMALSNLRQAKIHFRQELTNARALGWRQPIIHLQNNLADIALREGDLEKAARLLDEGLPLAIHADDKRRVALYMRSLAHLERARGNPIAARDWAAKALDAFERLGMAQEAEEMRQVASAVAIPIERP